MRGTASRIASDISRYLCPLAMKIATWNVNSVRARLERLLAWLQKVQPDEVGEIQVLSAYVPNGQVAGSEPYAYKLDWLRRLRAFLERHFTPETPLVLCGDFNVARDERDVADPAAWEETVLYHPTSRAALEELLAWGLVDVHRQQHPEGKLFSWWDYQALAFPRNQGLRLDHIFATQPLASRCTSAEIDRQERKGQKPSDHAPVVAEFEG